jgi:hypothetical protein
MIRIMKYRKLSRTILFLFIISLGVLSCDYNNEEELYPQNPDNPQVCDTAGLSYNVKIAELLNTNCASSGCHDGSVSPNLSNYDRVSNRLNQIENRALVRGDMPPSSRTPLSDCDKQQLQTWISNGGPED